MYLNENSPIYNGLSNTDLWDKLPESLVREVDDIYRRRHAELKKKI